MKARSSGAEAGRSRHGAIGADAVVTNDPVEMASTRFEQSALEDVGKQLRDRSVVKTYKLLETICWH